jgi:hypothetical protein
MAGEKIGFGDILIGAILVIFFLQIIALLLGVWVPAFRAIRLGQGVLLLAVMVSAFFAVALIKRKWEGGLIGRGDVLFFVLLIVLTILAIYFLPRMIPDIFAREEFVTTMNRMFQVS